MTSAELKALKERTTSRHVKRALVARYHAENEAARYYVALDLAAPRLKMAGVYLDTYMAEKMNLTGGQAAELQRIVAEQFVNAFRAQAERNGR